MATPSETKAYSPIQDEQFAIEALVAKLLVSYPFRKNYESMLIILKDLGAKEAIADLKQHQESGQKIIQHATRILKERQEINLRFNDSPWTKLDQVAKHIKNPESTLILPQLTEERIAFIQQEPEFQVKVATLKTAIETFRKTYQHDTHNYYVLLGISPTLVSTPSDFKKVVSRAHTLAWGNMNVNFTADELKIVDPQLLTEYDEIVELLDVACETLMDPEKRQAYDEELDNRTTPALPMATTETDMHLEPLKEEIEVELVKLQQAETVVAIMQSLEVLGSKLHHTFQIEKDGKMGLVKPAQVLMDLRTAYEILRSATHPSAIPTTENLTASLQAIPSIYGIQEKAQREFAHTLAQLQTLADPLAKIENNLLALDCLAQARFTFHHSRETDKQHLNDPAYIAARIRDLWNIKRQTNCLNLLNAISQDIFKLRAKTCFAVLAQAKRKHEYTIPVGFRAAYGQYEMERDGARSSLRSTHPLMQKNLNH